MARDLERPLATKSSSVRVQLVGKYFSIIQTISQSIDEVSLPIYRQFPIIQKILDDGDWIIPASRLKLESGAL